MPQPADDPGRGRRNVVVIGASAGGVETLLRVVSGLPADLAATVCIVLHVAPGSPSALPAILQRHSRLPCHAAVDGESLREGQVVIAPPDRHLTIAGGHVSLTVGPRENGHRPSVDALFRTAAAAQHRRVVGVILSGTRDDGTAGLAIIKARGGMAIVQDPSEAMYSGMPASAIAHVDVDAVVRSDRVAETIIRAVYGGPAGILAAANPRAVGGDRPQHGETAESNGDSFTSICPECGGVLSEHTDANVTQWRCRVGHRYSPESLADAQAEGVEAALWAAIRALEDRRVLLLRLGEKLEAGGRVQSAQSCYRRARVAADQADAVRAALDEAAQTTLQQLADSEAVESERRREG